MYEKLAYSCPCITSLHGFWLQSWSSFILDLYERYSMSLNILWQPYIMYYSVISFPFLSGSKSKKLMCEKLAFPWHWITAFHDFGFNLGGVLYHICGRVFLWVLCFWGSHFIPYITTMFHIILRTIYSTFPMSKSS